MFYSESDNPCRAKKNANDYFIGKFTMLTQLCDFFCVCFDLFFNERFSDVTLDRA